MSQGRPRGARRPDQSFRTFWIVEPGRRKGEASLKEKVKDAGGKDYRCVSEVFCTLETIFKEQLVAVGQYLIMRENVFLGWIVGKGVGQW